MKLAIFLLALAVAVNAASISISTEIVEKVQLPSVSALLVTELLEVTFHLPSDVAQAIGHIFRDVPISLAKEMIAFVVKVFGDITGGHLETLSQYMEQAIHIFSQVIEHINPKEVAALVIEEVLPAQWAAIIEKIFASVGKRDLGEYVDNLVDAIIDWGTTAIENVVTSVVTGFFGLFGKRMAEKGVVIDALVDTLIEELTSWTVSLIGGLFGKRSLEKGFFVSLVTAAVTTVVTNFVVDLVTDLVSGKRGIVDALMGAVTTVIENAVSSLVSGLFGLIGKRSVEKGTIIDAFVDTLIHEVTNLAINLVTGLFGGIGKRQAPGF